MKSSIWISCLALAVALALGCKNACAGERPASSAGPSPLLREAQSASERLHARLRARKLDRQKTYPKNPDGSIACASDVDCFVLQAERCAKADLTHVQILSGFGMVQRVEAHYEVEGKDGEHCKLKRKVLSVGVSIDARLEQALRKQGKSDADIDALKREAERNLRKGNPTLVECTFSDDQVLTVALDLAEQKLDPAPWRSACQKAVLAGSPDPDEPMAPVEDSEREATRKAESAPVPPVPPPAAASKKTEPAN